MSSTSMLLVERLTHKQPMCAGIILDYLSAAGVENAGGIGADWAHRDINGWVFDKTEQNSTRTRIMPEAARSFG